MESKQSVFKESLWAIYVTLPKPVYLSIWRIMIKPAEQCALG